MSTCDLLTFTAIKIIQNCHATFVIIKILETKYNKNIIALIFFTGKYEPTIDLLPTSVAS